MRRTTWQPVDGATASDELSLWCSPGAGPAVVLVHGMEDTWDAWGPLVAALSGNHRIYVLDMPWHAGSAHRWCERGTPAEWLRRGLDLVPEPIGALVGHSFGANAVLQLLATPGALPDGTRAVTLIAPFFRPQTLDVNWDLHRRALESVRRIMGQGLQLRLGDRAARLDQDALDAMAGVVMDRLGPVGFGAFFQLFASTTNLPLAGVSVPTLVLAGADDVSLAGDRAPALAAAMPAAQVHSRKHYTHFCHIEQVGDVAAELSSFLDEHLTRHLAAVSA